MSAVSVSGTASVRQVADRAVDAVLDRETALGDEHPHGLDGVQRHRRRRGRRWPGRPPPAARARARRAARAWRLRQRLEVQREEVALAGAPVGAPLEQLRAGERHHVDGDVAAPLEQVVDEVEQARVGVVVVLEHHDHGRGRGEPLEERAPGAEQLLGAHARADAQEREQGGLDPAPLGLIGDVLGEGRGDLRPGGGGVVGLEQPAAAADHLAQRPEADALAVGRGAAVVPPDLSPRGRRGTW